MAHPEQSETQVNLDEATQAQEGQQPTQETPKEEGERLYGGQFKTVEELEAAFLAAQKPAEDEPKGEQDEPKGEQDELTIGEADEDDARDALARAGLDLNEFSEEFNTNGELSEDSYKKLEAAGFPKDLVDVYVDGLRARVQSYENAVYEPAGGKDNYAALVQWAKTNLSAEQKRAFNDAVQSGDAGRAALAVQGLVALRGGSSRLLHGKTAASADSGAKPFQSTAQVVQAMRDPRYHRDPAYRKEVSERLAVSPLFQ